MSTYGRRSSMPIFSPNRCTRKRFVFTLSRTCVLNRSCCLCILPLRVRSRGKHFAFTITLCEEPCSLIRWFGCLLHAAVESTYQGRCYRSILIVAYQRRAIVLLLPSIEQGGRCYRAVRYLCDDGVDRFLKRFYQHSLVC